MAEKKLQHSNASMPVQPLALDPALLVSSTSAASTNVLTVGKNGQYATIADAVAHASSGDTIDVQAGTYNDDFVTIRQDLTLQAVGGTVYMTAGQSPPDGKAIITEGTTGIQVTINGFDISGAQVSAGNGAAIRYEGGTLTLNNDYLHNNQDGILAAADPTGAIALNNVEVAFNGIGDGYTHNLYIGDINSLTISNSYIHDANLGHEIKSRAENNTITNNRIYDNSSTASYSIDLPNGGNAIIQGNTIEQGANSGNPIIISYGEEGGLYSGTSVSIDSNTIVNDENSKSALAVRNAAPNTLDFTSNQVYGLTSGQIASGNVAASNTSYLSSRPTLSQSAPCFAAGTHIRTLRGDVPVEALTEGEPIVLHGGGTLPLRWLGHRQVDLTRHPQSNLAAPVRIRAHALAQGQPCRDLLVSPDHCLFVDGSLIPAKLLINNRTIRQERTIARVDYYHVELDRHDVILADGLPVESYLDTGNRAHFQNAGVALVLHPEFAVNASLRQWQTDACAPLLTEPCATRPVWQRVMDRAIAQGFPSPGDAVSTDPMLRLQHGSRSLRPISVDSGRYQFALPPSSGGLRLVSRAAVPSDRLAYLDEWRRLGVAVRRIAVRHAGGVLDIPLDHPGLGEGWHDLECDAATMWRWTDGNAVLPVPPIAGPCLLTVELGMSLPYPLPDSVAPGERSAA